jgi:type I restriction-modification system DNA methylase subunit
MSPHQSNLAIEKLVAQKGDSRAAYTPAELALLERFTGAGGLAKQGATGRGLLSEFYTPDAVVEMMWRLAIDHGAVWFRPEKPCRILEPAVGTGAFIRHFYREHIQQVTRGSIQIRAFETSPVSAKIARVLVDDPARFTVWEESFERAFIENNTSVGGRINRVFAEWRDFDLVIGNPPYGVYKSYAGGLGEKAHTKARQWEHYFIQRGLDVLKPGGYLIMVVPSGFVRSQYDYAESKKCIAERAMLMDSFRLPNGVFAATDVGTDILVFRRNDFTPAATRWTL